MSELATKLKEVAPMLQISARVDSYGDGPPEDTKYMKERHARIKKAIKVAEDQIKNWDAEAVASQALKSLKADLAKQKAELMVCEAEMDAAKSLKSKAKSKSHDDDYPDMEDEDEE